VLTCIEVNLIDHPEGILLPLVVSKSRVKSGITPQVSLSLLEIDWQLPVLYAFPLLGAYRPFLLAVERPGCD